MRGSDLLLGSGMFLLKIILIFIVIPAAMIVAALATGPAGARLITYVLFPAGLLAFAVGTYILGISASDEDPGS